MENNKLIIKRIVRDENGNIEATMMLSPEQAAFLINMGLVALVSAGTVQYQDMTEDEFKAEVAKDATAQSDTKAPAPAGEIPENFLAVLDKDTLHKA